MFTTLNLANLLYCKVKRFFYLSLHFSGMVTSMTKHHGRLERPWYQANPRSKEEHIALKRKERRTHPLPFHFVVRESPFDRRKFFLQAFSLLLAIVLRHLGIVGVMLYSFYRVIHKLLQIPKKVRYSSAIPKWELPRTAFEVDYRMLDILIYFPYQKDSSQNFQRCE